MNQPQGNYFNKFGSTDPMVQKMMENYLKSAGSALKKINRPSKILEVGCGDGIITDFIHESILHLHPSCTCQLVGVDNGFEIISKAKNKYSHLHFLTSDVMRLPFATDQFDLVAAPEVLEHLDDPWTALKEIQRVGNGYFLFSVPWEPVWRVGNVLSGRYLKNLGNTPGHIQHWSRRAFVRMIKSHFTVLEVLKPFPWTMVLAKK